MKTLIGSMYSNDTPSRGKGHGTLPDRKSPSKSLPPVVAEAIKEIPVAREWNAESDRIHKEMFGPGFDAEYESNKPFNIEDFLSGIPDRNVFHSMNAREKINYFKENFPDVANQPGYKMHPVTEQWAVDNLGKARSQNFMEWVDDQVLTRQYLPSTGTDRGTLLDRKLPPIVAEAIKPDIEIDPKNYFDRKGAPINPSHERWGEWNEDTDRLFAKKYPDFDVKEEQGKLRRIGYHVLDNTPLGMAHPDEDDFRNALPFFREHWPELAKNKKYAIHPYTEQYLKDPRYDSLSSIEEYGADDLLKEQWEAVAKQLYGEH